MQKNNFIDELQNQIYFLKLKALKWDKPPVVCKAPVYTQTGEDYSLKDLVPFKLDDDTFSVQGDSRLSARHACGKALLERWRILLGKKHPIDLRSMISYLMTSIPKGSNSLKVTDFAEVRGQITDPNTDKVYEMEI